MSKPDSSKPSKEDAANPYKDTLFLPRTEFPMRGSLPQQEPARLQKWQSEKLYEGLRKDAKARKGADFDLKEFHRAALDLGSLGLDPLRAALARI